MSEASPPSQHAAVSPFSPAELEQLHSEDRTAAAYIIGLMVAIFSIGVVLYLCVCYSAA